MQRETVQIIPVIDIKEGIVVRGVAGERAVYRPVESCLTDSHQVVDVAHALRETFGVSRLYVADLDAIGGRPPHVELYRQLRAVGFELFIDAGLRSVVSAQALVDLGITNIIAGLETLTGPDLLSDLITKVGEERLIFSLDMQQGRPLLAEDAAENWPDEPFAIAKLAYAAGVRRMILLDLAAVGVGSGPAALPLCERVRGEFPDCEIITGGGIRGVNDLIELKRRKIDGVLIASALHNGSITREDLTRIS